jgi:ABC-2 type transport system permease protein
MSRDPAPSFSAVRKWRVGLNLAVALLATLAILLMVNYLAARHFSRFPWSSTAQAQLSPLTRRALEGVTNRVKVTVFFDRQEPLYEAVSDLLREYQYVSDLIEVEAVDYIRDPPRAQLSKAKYKLSHVSDKDLVIFECNGRTKMVYQNELSELDVQPLLSGQSREIKRTGFKGELLFTSAILSVTSLRSLKAYFLEGHREHSPADNDADQGYSKFAGLLKANNIDWSRLALEGTNDVPADCSLLILAGQSTPLEPVQLEKIRRYLANGGRLFALFNFFGVQNRANSGIIQVLDEWGVRVGNDLIQDPPNSNVGQDLVIGQYGIHPITKPLVETRLHVLLPRSVQQAPRRPAAAEAPSVAELFFTGPKGIIITDIREGVPYPHPATDVRTNVCLAVAVEKGKVRDITADRGTTRLVVVGDSFFLNNRMIDSAANQDFAALSINWLLDRTQLLGGLTPRPVTEYKLNITHSQRVALSWILLLGMPGSVLVVGLMVWTRRRR